MRLENYDISEALIFCNDKVKTDGTDIYMPIYMSEFLRKRDRYDI